MCDYERKTNNSNLPGCNIVPIHRRIMSISSPNKHHGSLTDPYMCLAGQLLMAVKKSVQSQAVTYIQPCKYIQWMYVMHIYMYMYQVYVLCAHSNTLVSIYQDTEQHNCMVYYHSKHKTKYIHQAKYSLASQHMHLQLMLAWWSQCLVGCPQINSVSWYM